VGKLSLAASAPLTGALPVRNGGMSLTLVDPGPLWSVAPFAGQGAAVSSALKAAIGLTLPEPGRRVTEGAVALQWFGRDLWLLSGAEPPKLPAALTDQSDSWVTLDLTGPRGAEVMARLVPVDLREAAFPEGAAVRTDLHTMMVAVARTGPETLRIMGFRSMAGTLVHALGEAMETVAGL